MQHPPGPAAEHLPLRTLTPNVSEADYNRDPGLRSTELKAACRTAAHWKAYLDEPRRQTDEMAFGTLVHMAILEPDRFRRVAHQRPDFGDQRSAANKAEAQKWAADLPEGAVVYTAEDRAHLMGIYRRVTQHSRAKALLEGSQREVALAWEDSHYGLRCKARYDILTKHGFVADLKTCRDASYEAFSKELVNRNYTLSAAHYLEGLRQCELGDPDKFFIIACEKTPPYELAVFSLAPAVLKRGRAWQRLALANVKEAREAGVFAGYPEAVQTLEEPGYAPLPPGCTRQQLYEE